MSAVLPPAELDSARRDTDRSESSRYSIGRRMTPQSPNEALQPEAAPPPPPALPPSRKRRRLSALSGFLSFVLIAAIAAMVGIVVGEQRLRDPGPLIADKVVFIQKGSTEEIVDKLADEGVIDSPIVFHVALAIRNLRGDKERLKAGEYLFKRQASVDDVVATLIAGKQILHAITIPEGLTSQQVLQRLHDSDVLTGDVRDAPKEGAILPETYKVARGTTRSELINKMKDDQRRTVEQIWARRSPDLPLRSPYELVTLASIVEKETGKADERSRVAGVFINRLRKRMRLQSDPTIVYGLVGGQGTLGHSISRAELDRPTPYNTYTIDGLPPGPIDNPGRAALEAVANPSRTGDLYFVADGTGGHAFAETVEQHNKNVQRWRQIERDAKDKTPADVDKVEPAAMPSAPAPRPGTRGDASDSIFGGLPSRQDMLAPRKMAGSFLEPALTHDIDALASGGGPAATEKPAGVATRPTPANDKTAAARFVVGPGIDTLGLSIQGARPTAAAALDGPVNSVSDDPAPDRPVQTSSLADPASATPAAKPPDHPKIFDVSEGTAIDPLRDKSYDLNSAKTVPDLTKPGP